MNRAASTIQQWFRAKMIDIYLRETQEQSSEESLHHSVLDMEIQDTDMLIEQEQLVDLEIHNIDVFIEQEKMVSMLSSSSKNEKLFETSMGGVVQTFKEAAAEERAFNMPV